jgi:RHS repeat-associated protein
VGYQRSGFSLTPNTFTWSLPLVTPGDYRVYVRWVSDPSYSTGARYTVAHDGGSTVHTIDQTTGGGGWYLLGTYAFTTTAQVSLGDPAGGTLVADAVRLIPVTALTDTASWSAPEAQSYQVYARWPAAAHHSKRAVYTVAHAGGSTDLIQDQTQAGGQWNLLGTYTFSSTSQGVSLRADPDATTVADAIRFIPTGSSVTQQTTAYVHADHLGMVQKMTDSAQQVVWQAIYEPFGEAAITKQAYYDSPLRFPGQYFDAETGLHQNWNRDYDPTIGRYLQSDPIGLDGGINTYAYGASNPLTMIDPDGLLFIDPTGSMPDDTTGPTRPPKPKECEACEGDDRVVVEIKSTVCRMGDVMCEIAYRQAGIPGPYTPHKRVFSKRCLMTMGMLVKPAGFAASEGAVRVVPRVARAAGASEGTASALGRWAGRLFGWQMGAALLPIVGDQIMNDCECGK